MTNRRIIAAAGMLLVGTAATQSMADNIEVIVTIENLAPANGTHQTPFWVGFHNGTFDTFNAGAAASAGLEQLAEDGDTSGISTAFGISGAGSIDGTIASNTGIPPYAPGELGTMNFIIDTSTDQFFSFLSMVLPSNDAFVGNDDAMGIQIVDGLGNFVGADFFVSGAMVWDAGTEVNDELPANTAFFGQANPNTGVDENGVVHLHGGYIGAGGGEPGPILSTDDFAGGDFTLPGYPIARITVAIVPAPGALALLILAGGFGATVRRRRIA